MSLLEATIVLGIVGLVTGAIWVAVATARQNSQAQALEQQTTEVVRNIRSFFSSRILPSTAGDLTTYDDGYMRSKNIFPLSTCNGSCLSAINLVRAKNSYGGAFTFGSAATSYQLPANGGLPVANSFLISHIINSRQGCMTFVPWISASSNISGLTRIDVYSTSVASAVSFTTFPVTPDQAVTACGASGYRVDMTYALRD